MAGGEGSRLRPLTINRPKPLVSIVNQSCLGHLFDLLKRHGITVLGRNVSECYGRVNILAAEVKRNILAEQLAAIRGTQVDRISKAEMEEMYRHGDAVMYPQVKK